ncbi:MAG: 1,4-alpha-glucan branching protein GlgB [Oscillospiraceae bacterium]|nr:1,4-alpha-glucan branching protein GlgB [Oscillospiraceae bacterium]
MSNILPIKEEHKIPLHLYREGELLEGYKFFGSHFEICGEKTGYRFRVWAPRARSVSVVGDFNYWDRACHEMNLIETTGVWEIFIPDLKKFDAYKYSIEGPSGMIQTKADPYGTHMETRPNTATKIYDISKYNWKDEKWQEKIKNQNVFRSPLNIYEVHLGSWHQKGDEGEFLDYMSIASRLVPYVKKMGYTHIELMPIAEFPFDGSWGYQGIGYYAPTSRFGTPHDFMEFIDYCHCHDIGVILDWVPAHFPKDAAGLYEFDGECCYEYSDPLKREHHNWGTRIFDWGKAEVQSFLISNAYYWLKEYHIDGLRVDAVASMLYLDYDRREFRPNRDGGNENIEAIAFLKKLNANLFKVFPNILMIAEESTAWPMVTKPPEVGGLGFNFKWNMGWMNDMLAYMSLSPEFRHDYHGMLTFSFHYAFSENYILPISHDEVVHGKCSLLDKMSGPREKRMASFRTFLAYMAGHPGKTLMFMGQEFAQFKEWNYQTGLDWDIVDKFDEHKKIHEFTRRMNAFYLESSELWENESDWSGFKWIVPDDNINSVLVFRRINSSGDELIVVCNFQPREHSEYTFGVPYLCDYEEVFSTDDVEFGGDGKTNGIRSSVQTPMHDEHYSLTVQIPASSAFFLKAVKKDDKKNGVKDGNKSKSKSKSKK